MVWIWLAYLHYSVCGWIMLTDGNFGPLFDWSDSRAWHDSRDFCRPFQRFRSLTAPCLSCKNPGKNQHIFSVQASRLSAKLGKLLLFKIKSKWISVWVFELIFLMLSHLQRRSSRISIFLYPARKLEDEAWPGRAAFSIQTFKSENSILFTSFYLKCSGQFLRNLARQELTMAAIFCNGFLVISKPGNGEWKDSRRNWGEYRINLLKKRTQILLD